MKLGIGMPGMGQCAGMSHETAYDGAALLFDGEESV